MVAAQLSLFRCVEKGTKYYILTQGIATSVLPLLPEGLGKKHTTSPPICKLDKPPAATIIFGNPSKHYRLNT